MPLYEFQCESCHERFEKIQKFSDPTPESCPKCGAGPVRKLPSSPAIQFKGTGWYITDYAKKNTTDAGKTKADKGPSEKSTSGGESAKGDSGKSDSASTTKSDSTTTSSADTSSKKN